MKSQRNDYASTLLIIPAYSDYLAQPRVRLGHPAQGLFFFCILSQKQRLSVLFLDLVCMIIIVSNSWWSHRLDIVAPPSTWQVSCR